ncbi:unnamed protein product, partial [Rotaria magnacalcarata]
FTIKNDYLSYHPTDTNRIKIFNQLVLIYESRLNTESNNTYIEIDWILNISITTKEEGIDNGLTQSQIDYLKCIQSDKCMSKNDVLIDECIQALSILNSLSFDCPSAKDILSSSSLIAFLHQL